MTVKELYKELSLLIEQSKRFTTLSDYPFKDEYAKTIIQDLLNNSDEYARERAINFLKGE